MHVFIDESGVFKVGASSYRRRSNCVASVTVPSKNVNSLINEFENLVRPFRKKGKEVKGRLLPEEILWEITRILVRNKCIIDACFFDPTIENESLASEHQQRWRSKTLEILERDQSFQKDFVILRSHLSRLSLQDHIKMVLIVSLISHVIYERIVFKSQRDPEDIGAFEWEIDQLSQPLIEIFNKCLGVFIADKWRDFYFYKILNCVDMSYFESSFVNEDRTINVKKMLSTIKFLDSRKSSGIQIADCINTIVGRALEGKISNRIMNLLPSVTVKAESFPLVFRPLLFRPSGFQFAEAMYVHAVGWLSANALDLLTEEFRAEWNARRPEFEKLAQAQTPQPSDNGSRSG